MYTVRFWRDAAERAVKTFAQTLLATIAVGTAITDLDWEAGLGISATAVVASFLTSIISEKIGQPESASALPEK